MADININEYVRTDNGEIHKVEDIEDLRIHIKTEKIMFRSWVDDYYGSHKEDRFIVKHSQNIIDLIEIGDYVNGRLVLQVDYKNKNVCLLIPLTDTLANTNSVWYGYEDIKAVVTHEQISNIEYRLEN